MPNHNDLENKLADWFKYVDRQAEAVKHAGSKPPAEEEPKEIISKIPVQETPEVVEEVEEQDSVVVDRPRFLGQRRTPPLEILDEPEIPEVEDFLPFLKEPPRQVARPVEEEKPLQEEKLVPKAPEPSSAPTLPPPVAQPVTPAPPSPVMQSAPPAAPPPPAPSPITPTERLEPGQPEPEQQRALFVTEGTGMPRLRPRPVEEEKSEEKTVEPPEQEAVQGISVPVRPVTPPDELTAANVREMWDKLPRHIQLLLGTQQREVPGNSYKVFRETRQELIQRLLDPALTLEEVARILNVCPTTVRRYTNRGVLPHFRTAGNQRRFRLSDVLAFLESNYSDAGQS